MPKGTILVECGKMLRRGTPKTKAVIGKNGKPLKDKHGNQVTEVVKRNGKVVYEPYRIKVLNTIDFKKSMHYNPFLLLYKGGKKTSPKFNNKAVQSFCGTKWMDNRAVAVRYGAGIFYRRRNNLHEVVVLYGRRKKYLYLCG